MARIPLILTLLALAYQDAGDSARQLRNLSLSPSGLRDEIIQSYMRKRYQFEQARLPEGDRLPFSLETIRSLLGEVGATLLDYSQRIRLEVTDNKVTIRSYDEQAAAFVEIHKSAFRNILGPRAHTFTEIAGRLHLLIPSGRDHFRFSHLLLRDHFSFAYCITRLSSRNRQLGRACIGALGLIRDTRAVASLIQVIDDTDRTNSALAIWAIGEIGDPAGIQKLLAAVSHIPGDEGFRVMSMLCEALGKMGEQAIDVLGDLARKPEDFLAPAKAGQEEFSFPLQLITGPQAVRGLSLIGAPAIEKLIELLDDDLLTEDAAEALADMGDRRASEGLINAMEHSSEFARAKVADALGRVKDTAAIPILIAHARDKEPELRQSAIRALGEIADERAIQTLISIMDHPDPVTRLSAVQALGKFEGDEVRKELVKALDDGDLEVRDVAASVLEAQGFCKAILLEKQAPVSILRATLDSRDSRLRAVAAQALGRCRDVGAVEALIEVLFKDTDKWVRVNAAIALGKIGDPSATGALGIAITSDNAAVRKHAAASLGLLGGTDAVKILISALSDHEESVWREAGTAILTIGEMATEPLVAMLDGSDSQSQQIIEQLLGDMGEPAVSCLVGLLVSEQGADNRGRSDAAPASDCSYPSAFGKSGC
jgi:HEAT repeat protein